MKKIFSLFMATCLSAVTIISTNITIAKAEGQTNDTSITHETEDNNTRNLANALQANTQMIGSITAEDCDFYKFTMPENGYFTIDFSQYDYLDESNSNYVVKMYSADLECMAEYNYIYKLSSQNFAFKKGTELYFSVNGYNSSNDYSKQGNYCLKVNVTPSEEWENEFNSDKKSADILKQKIYATMYNSDDVDYFKYTAPNTGYVEFNFINEDSITDTSGWNYVIYDKDLNKLDDGDVKTDGKLDLIMSVRKGTVLYIKVTLYGSAVNGKTYSLEPKFVAKKYVEIESNDTFSKANNLILGKTYYATNNLVSETAEYDYFKFKAKRSKKYKIRVSFNSDLGADQRITVYDSKKKELKHCDTKSSCTITINAKKGKTYYISSYRASGLSYWYNYLYKINVSK